MERRKTMSYIAFSCWSIWKARCDEVFNLRISSSTRTVRAIENASFAFLEAYSREQALRVSEGNDVRA